MSNFVGQRVVVTNRALREFGAVGKVAILAGPLVQVVFEAGQRAFMAWDVAPVRGGSAGPG